MNIYSNYILDFFLPRFCPGCNKKLSSEENAVCDSCIHSILIADDERLKIEFDKDFSTAKVITEFYSKYIFQAEATLQNIIHALKYGRKFKLGIFLGQILGEALIKRNWPVDLILPVPIHHLRKAERGYNQSDYIAKGISKSLKLPYSTRLISRTRHTESQTGLDKNERALNVSNAFKVKRAKSVIGKNILLVDDVCTTGVTLQECGIVLRKAGAGKIYVSSIAVAD